MKFLRKHILLVSGAALALVSLLLVLDVNRAIDKTFWPINQAKSVRICVYNYEYAEGPMTERAWILDRDGKLNSTVVFEKTLDSAHIEELSHILRRVIAKQLRGNTMACYVPNHAFVFYDKSGKITGFFEVSFPCNQFRYSVNEGYSIESDLEPIRIFLEKLNVPVRATRHGISQ